MKKQYLVFKTGKNSKRQVDLIDSYDFSGGFKAVFGKLRYGQSNRFCFWLLRPDDGKKNTFKVRYMEYGCVYKIDFLGIKCQAALINEGSLEGVEGAFASLITKHPKSTPL